MCRVRKTLAERHLLEPLPPCLCHRLAESMCALCGERQEVGKEHRGLHPLEPELRPLVQDGILRRRHRESQPGRRANRSAWPSKPLGNAARRVHAGGCKASEKAGRNGHETDIRYGSQLEIQKVYPSDIRYQFSEAQIHQPTRWAKLLTNQPTRWRKFHAAKMTITTSATGS